MSTVNVTPIPTCQHARRHSAPATVNSNHSSCSHSAQQQTRRPPLLLYTDGTERRTYARPLHRPGSVFYASSINYENYSSDKDKDDKYAWWAAQYASNKSKMAYSRHIEKSINCGIAALWFERFG